MAIIPSYRLLLNSSLQKYYLHVLLTNIVDLGGLFLRTEATVGHVNIGITTRTIATIELALAQVHLRLSKL